jgi:hypothetical protein
MKSGTIKSAQRDAAGRVTQLPLQGVVRESGVTTQAAPRPAEASSAVSNAGPTWPAGADQSAPRASATVSPTANGGAVLCNIAEQSWILHRTHGTFVVAGRAAGETFALTIIGARTGAIDLGDKRTLEFPITAREIADDLAREINSDGGEGSYFGAFVCKGDEPSDAELLIARTQLDAFYRNLVAVADKEWERTQNVVFISDLQRRAARELKLEKEWSYEPQQRIDCPACGEKLKPGVAVCRVCGAVLDRATAAIARRVTVAAPAV